MNKQEPTCTRKLEFDAGHRLINHEGKCKNYHGHRYVVEVTCGVVPSGSLDSVGRVVDFSVMKTVFGSWIDKHLDHGMVLQKDDPFIDALRCINSKLFIMEHNPTAENMVKLLFHHANRLFKEAKCGVDYSPEKVEVVQDGD